MIRFQDFRRNLFDGPPNITQEEWLDRMTDYCRPALLFGDGSINVKRDRCKSVLDAGQKLNSATFIEAFKATPVKARRAQDYFETLKRLVSIPEKPTYRYASGMSRSSGGCKARIHHQEPAENGRFQQGKVLRTSRAGPSSGT